MAFELRYLELFVRLVNPQQIHRKVAEEGRCLGQNIDEDASAFDLGEAGVEALEFDAEGVVANSELVERGGVEIVDGADVFDGGVAEVVGGLVSSAPQHNHLICPLRSRWPNALRRHNC
jgi:hypothetical protein